MGSEGLINEVREFWDRVPCNVRDSALPIGTREYFAEIERKKYLLEPHIPGFAQFERWKGKKVLEIGCGIGTDSINFARARADLTAVDLSETSLEITRNRLAEEGLKGRFYCGNAEDLSSLVPVEPYDLIYSYGVVHHTPQPERVLQEVQKFATPQTEVRLMLYAKWSLTVLWHVLVRGHGAFWKASQLVRAYGEAQEGCPVTYCYSFGAVRRLLRGFRVVEMRKANVLFPSRFKAYIRDAARRGFFHSALRLGYESVEQCVGWNILIVAKPRA